MSSVCSIIIGIFSAVLVYVIGQLLSKFFIDPLYELRKVIGEVRFTLDYHRVSIHTPVARTHSRSEESRNEIMKCSSGLVSSLHAVPGYSITRYIAGSTLPRRLQVEQAAVQLRGLSTHLYERGDKAEANIDIVNRRVKKIMKLLNLKPLPGEDDA